MEQEIIKALEEGATVVTANRRLARALRAQYGIFQQGRRRTVWETPDVLPWSGWLQRLWEFTVDLPPAEREGARPVLLTAWQEQALWERVIEESGPDSPLLNVHAAAETAREAWRLWHEWRLPLDEADGAPTPDTQAFLTWARAFRNHCAKEHLLDAARLTDYAVQCIETGALPLPERILLAGFDELTPQQRILFDTLRAQGCVIENYTPAPMQGQARHVALPDVKGEIEAAARWARTRFEADPDARIGIVVQNLTALRESIVRVFDDILHPEAVLPGGDSTARAYNVSLGRPLGDYPIARAALEILSLIENTIPIVRIGGILRSPFMADAETEFSRRASLDSRLRERSGPEVTLQTVQWLAAARGNEGRPRHFSCPLLAKRLRAFIAACKALPEKQSHVAWAQAFSDLLTSLGWPGERTLNSEEYQAARAWRDALHALAQRDRIAEAASRSQALDNLRRIAAETVFQPESADAPIQVLGVLEASGAQFDHLWVMGLHDEVWPGAARPNPFLPRDLQRQHGLPHSSAARELEVARTITTRLLASAPNVVVSYPLREGDRDLYPTPLIAGLDAVEVDEPDALPAAAYADLIHRSADLEMLIDDQGPALETGAQLSGGTRLLEDQAACPFRAFAIHRLGACGIEEPATGLDAMARGSLVHAALETVWSELKTHARLLDCTQDQLHEMVRAAVSEALERLRQKYRLGERFCAIEQRRVERLLLDWLDYEKQRAPFEVIALEQERIFSVGGLTLATRADRIDRLVDSKEQVIIDYKTGKPQDPEWFDDRPDQPQLPLYSVYSEGETAAVVLAYVRQGRIEFRGIAQTGGLMPDVGVIERDRGNGRESWNGLFDGWRSALEGLAGEVQAGEARVAPKNPPHTCEYCALSRLCRVNEIFAQTSPAAGEEDGS